MSMIRTAAQMIWSFLRNLFFDVDMVYVVDSAQWSIYWDGYYTVISLPKKIKAVVRRTAFGARASVIHYGTINLFLRERSILTRQIVIVSWFHIDPEMDLSAVVPLVNKHVTYLHTTCEITKRALMDAGVDEHKIIVIPLGIDLQTFSPPSASEREKIRVSLHIPADVFVIGSFQKDGVGWGQGLEPKKIKGPDLFCDAVIEVHKKHPVHVLLSGPSRGYVKKRLQEANIPFTHTYVSRYGDMNRLYNAIDVYAITSRAEGGPKALLEAWATGVPVISTAIGMVKDIGIPDNNVLLCEHISATCIARYIHRVVSDAQCRKRLSAAGIDAVKPFAYSHIAAQYWNKLYSSFI